jgi:acyl-coenzyme A synthetase/AMP-(fatty) acid ligase/acyl carrier protein
LGPGDVIAVSSNEVEIQLSHCLGVLKAGATYVAVDPSLPKDRYRLVLKRAGVAVCIATDIGLPADERYAADRPDILPPFDEPIDGVPQVPAVSIKESFVSHILFTSGSTGEPKVVPRTHRALLNNCARHGALGLDHSDRVTLFTRRGFFDSVSNPLMVLLSGGTVCASSVMNPEDGALDEWLVSEAPTVYYSFPTLFRALLNAPKTPAAMGSLRLLYLGGEQVRESDLTACRRLLAGNAVLAIGLGSTETGLIALKLCRALEIDPSKPPSVGFPVRGVDIEICANGPSATPGEPGEIVVRVQDAEDHNEPPPSHRTGDLGYYNDAGELVIAGRADQTVKIRGFRVALFEIDSCLANMNYVSEAATIVANSSEDDTDHVLLSFVVTTDPAIIEEAIRVSLKEALPDYMVPHRVLILSQMPKTENGKIDRKALGAVQWRGGRSHQIAFDDHIDRKISDLWRQVLNVYTVHKNDNFFDLGGTSIRALQLTTLVRREFANRIPLSLILEAPTFGAFCARCKEAFSEAALTHAGARRPLREGETTLNAGKRS